MAAPDQVGLLLSSQNAPQGQPGVIKASTFFCFSYLVKPGPSPYLLPYRACLAPGAPTCRLLGCNPVLPGGPAKVQEAPGKHGSLPPISRRRVRMS